MKKKFRWVVIIACVCLAFVGAYAALIGYGKRLAMQRLGEAFQAQAHVGAIEFSLPLSLRLTDLEFTKPTEEEPFFVVDEASIAANPFSLVQRELEIQAITLRRPQLALRIRPKGSKGAAAAPQATSPTAQASQDATPKTRLGFPLFIRQIQVIDGDLRLINEEISDPPHIIHLGKLGGIIKRLPVPPRAGQAPFELSAEIFGRGFLAPGQIKASGWVDFSSRDLNLELLCAAIDLPHLSPYYRQAVQDEMLSGRVNLASTLDVRSNRLKASSHLEVNDLVFVRPRSAVSTFFGIPTTNLITLLTDSQGHLELQFDVEVDLAERGGALRRIIAVAIGSALGKVVSKHFGRAIQEAVLELGEEGLVALGAESEEKLKAMGQELRKKLKAIFLPPEPAPPDNPSP